MSKRSPDDMEAQIEELRRQIEEVEKEREEVVAERSRRADAAAQEEAQQNGAQSPSPPAQATPPDSPPGPLPPDDAQSHGDPVPQPTPDGVDGTEVTEEPPEAPQQTSPVPPPGSDQDAPDQLDQPIAKQPTPQGPVLPKGPAGRGSPKTPPPTAQGGKKARRKAAAKARMEKGERSGAAQAATPNAPPLVQRDDWAGPASLKDGRPHSQSPSPPPVPPSSWEELAAEPEADLDKELETRPVHLVQKTQPQQTQIDQDAKQISSIGDEEEEQERAKTPQDQDQLSVHKQDQEAIQRLKEELERANQRCKRLDQQDKELETRLVHLVQKTQQQQSQIEQDAKDNQELRLLADAAQIKCGEAEAKATDRQDQIHLLLEQADQIRAQLGQLQDENAILRDVEEEVRGEISERRLLEERVDELWRKLALSDNLRSSLLYQMGYLNERYQAFIQEQINYWQNVPPLPPLDFSQRMGGGSPGVLPIPKGLKITFPSQPYDEETNAEQSIMLQYDLPQRQTQPQQQQTQPQQQQQMQPSPQQPQRQYQPQPLQHQQQTQGQLQQQPYQQQFAGQTAQAFCQQGMGQQSLNADDSRPWAGKVADDILRNFYQDLSREFDTEGHDFPSVYQDVKAILELHPNRNRINFYQDVFEREAYSVMFDYLTKNCSAKASGYAGPKAAPSGQRGQQASPTSVAKPAGPVGQDGQPITSVSVRPNQKWTNKQWGNWIADKGFGPVLDVNSSHDLVFVMFGNQDDARHFLNRVHQSSINGALTSVQWAKRNSGRQRASSAGALPPRSPGPAKVLPAGAQQQGGVVLPAPRDVHQPARPTQPNGPSASASGESESSEDTDGGPVPVQDPALDKDTA